MDFGKIGEELFGNISEKFDSFCSEVDEAINCKLSAVEAQIKVFWSEIVQDTVPESTKNIVNAEKEEVTNFSDSRMPTAIVDDEKNNIDTCPILKVNPVVPADHLRRESSLEENAAMGTYNNSNASGKDNCIDETNISSLGSFESVSGSCIEWETSSHVNTNTEVASDRQADDSVASSKLFEAKLSDQGVESDDLLPILLLGKSDVSGTEDVQDLEDYEKVDEISHREWSTVGVDGSVVTEEFMCATLPQLAKPEFYEDFIVVSTSEISSTPSLEKISGKSSLKSSVEIKKSKHLEDQEQVKSFAPTFLPADSVGWDEEISDVDWVVL